MATKRNLQIKLDPDFEPLLRRFMDDNGLESAPEAGLRLIRERLVTLYAEGDQSVEMSEYRRQAFTDTSRYIRARMTDFLHDLQQHLAEMNAEASAVLGTGPWEGPK